MHGLSTVSELSTQASASPERDLVYKALIPSRMSSLRAIDDFVLLSDEEEEKMLRSVGYTKSRLVEDVALLRAWVAQQPHFPPSSRTECDEFFMNFLIGCKGSIERCKKKLDGYYTWRRKSVLFADRKPNHQHIMDVCESVSIALMPKCLPTGYRLSIMKFKSPKKYDVVKLCRHIVLAMELRIRCFGIAAGDTVVMDLANFTPAYLSTFNPSVVRDFIAFIQGSLANRCDRYYFINCPPFNEIFYKKMLLPFMSKKMSERITVTREGHELLYEIFPKEVLPGEYGGEGPSTESVEAKWIQAFLDLAKEGEGGLISRLSELTDESKRPKDSQHTVDESIFGIQGTIKTLSID